MGSWVTLHLLDERKLSEKVIPDLRSGNSLTKEHITEYLRLSYLGGIQRLNVDQLERLILQTISNIKGIVHDYDILFEKDLQLLSYKEIEDKILAMNHDERQYDYGRFFEYLIFKYCADFIPHIALGKAGAHNIYPASDIALINDIIGKSQKMAGLYSQGNMGIESWIPADDTELLYYCYKELPFEEDNQFQQSILLFLEEAFKKQLGLVIGRDMNENMIERLPPYKLASEQYWIESNNKERFLFRS